MNLIDRVKNIIYISEKEWDVIATETPIPARLLPAMSSTCRRCCISRFYWYGLIGVNYFGVRVSRNQLG